MPSGGSMTGPPDGTCRVNRNGCGACAGSCAIRCRTCAPSCSACRTRTIVSSASKPSLAPAAGASHVTPQCVQGRALPGEPKEFAVVIPVPTFIERTCPSGPHCCVSLLRHRQFWSRTRRLNSIRKASRYSGSSRWNAENWPA